MVAAHRGAHSDVPENSVASIQEAIKHDIEIVEIDIRISKDGIPVLMHDDKVDRTTTGKGDVEDFELSQLKQLQLLHNGKKTEQSVPTLAEVLEIGKDKILFDLDLKTSQIEKVMDVVEDIKAQNSVFFFDSDWKILEKVKAAHPDWKIMPRAYNEQEAIEAFRKFKPWAIHVDPSFASAELADYFHSRGVHVWINALGDVDEDLSNENLASFKKLMSTNSNIIQTDYPRKIKTLIRTDEFSADLSKKIINQLNMAESEEIPNLLPELANKTCNRAMMSVNVGSR